MDASQGRNLKKLRIEILCFCSAGPKSLQGKTNVSRNAFKGGKRVQLRADVMMLKLALTRHKQFLDELLACEP